MSPLRPPDVQRAGGLVTRYQRRLASQDATAYDLANRIFNAALPSFGPQTRMPLVYWRSRTPGRRPLLDLETDPAVPLAEAEPGGRARDRVTRQLGVVAYPYQANPFNPRARPATSFPTGRKQQFADTLLHELAHTQQDPTGFGNKFRIEGGADAFAALTRDYVARRLGWGPRATTPFRSGYGDLGAQFIHRFGPQQALRGQFPYRNR
jgi:hypothetical protein